MQVKGLLFSFAIISAFFAYNTLCKPVENTGTYTPLLIQMARNLSNQKALLGDKTGHEIVDPFSTISLEPGLKIPFVSIKRYMNQYVKNKPYAPANALKIKTQQGLFYIWESEAGVVCAPDPKRLNIGLEWEANTLLKVNSDGPENRLSAAVLRLLILINKQGEIRLERLQRP